MSYEYTVAHPFTLPKGNGGQFKAYLVGQKISDPAEIEAVTANNSRNVVRHAVTTPAKPQEKATEADPMSEAVDDALRAGSAPVAVVRPLQPTPAASTAAK